MLDDIATVYSDMDVEIDALKWCRDRTRSMRRAKRSDSLPVGYGGYQQVGSAPWERRAPARQEKCQAGAWRSQGDEMKGPGHTSTREHSSGP